MKSLISVWQVVLVFGFCVTHECFAQQLTFDQLAQQRISAVAILNGSQVGERLSALHRLRTADEGLLKIAGLQANFRASLQGELVAVLSDLSQLATGEGNWKEAEDLLRSRHAIQAERFGPDSWQTTDARLEIETLRKYRDFSDEQRKQFQSIEVINAKAVQLFESGNSNEAFREIEKAAEIKVRLVGRDSWQYASSLASIADLYELRHQYAQAIDSYVQVNSIRKKSLGENHPDYALGVSRLAYLLRETGRYRQAETLAEDATAVFARAFGKESSYYAISLVNHAMISLQAGSYAEAEPRFLEAKELLSRTVGTEHHEYATCVSGLGTLFYLQGDYKRSEEHHLEGLAINEKNHGKESLEYALSLNGLAGLYQAMSDYERAEPLMNQVKVIRRKTLGEEHHSYATALQNLAVLYQSKGEYAQAEPLLLEALAIYERSHGQEHPDYANCVSNLGVTYAELGEYASADRLLSSARSLKERLLGRGNPSYAKSLISIAGVYEKRGQFARSESLLREAQAIIETALGKGHPEYARVLDALAGLSVSAGDHARAELLFVAALEIKAESLGKLHPDYGATLNNLAVLYDIIGDYRRAEPCYLESIEIIKNQFGKDHPSYAVTLNNLAMLYQHLGDPTRAERFCNESQEIFESVFGKESDRYASGLNNQAIILQGGGDYRRAERKYLEAISIRENLLGRLHPDTLLGLNGLGQLYCLMGDERRAQSVLADALNRGIESAKDSLRSKSEAAALKLLQAKFIGSDPVLSIRRESDPQSDDVTYGFVWRSSGLLESFLNDRRAARYSSPITAAHYEDLSRVSRRLSQLTLAQISPNQRSERQQELARLTETKEDLERKLVNESGSFRRGKEVEDASPADLMKMLHEGMAIVHFVKTAVWKIRDVEDRKLRAKWEYDAFVLKNTDVGHCIKWLHLGSGTEIEAAVGDWLTLIDQGRGEATSDRHPAAVLRKRLWEPLEDHLEGVKHVVVIPDSATSFLPWAALPGREPGTFLLEDYTLSTALSGRELYRQLTEPASENSKLLILGGVDYQSRGEVSVPITNEDSGPRLLASRGAAMDLDNRIQWNALPGTVSETDSIAAMWPSDDSVQKLIGTGGNEDALQSAMPGAKYIHLATHGFFADPKFRSALQHDPKSEQLFQMPGFDLATAGRATVTGRNPLILSGIVLAGANLPPEKDELGLPSGADGIMTAQEVVYTDLRGTELVTLSACDTGKGTQVAGGEGIYGLQRAFHLAGARHVVASLWKVDDQATAALMKLFYYNLWIKKQPVAEALRGAQLALLRNPDQIETLATSRGPNFNKTVEATRDAATPPDRTKSKRAPIRLWAAFTHSGPPAPLKTW